MLYSGIYFCYTLSFAFYESKSTYRMGTLTLFRQLFHAYRFDNAYRHYRYFITKYFIIYKICCRLYTQHTETCFYTIELLTTIWYFCAFNKSTKIAMKWNCTVCTHTVTRPTITVASYRLLSLDRKSCAPVCHVTLEKNILRCSSLSMYSFIIHNYRELDCV